MRAASLIGLSGLFVTLWSSGWLASQLVMSELDVVTVLNARYLIVLLTLLIIVTTCGHWRRISLPDLLGHMCVGVLSHAIYLTAALSAFQQGASAGLVAFIVTLHPMATALLSGCVNQEKVSARQWKGLLAGTLAVLLLASQNYRHGASGFALALPFMAVLALTLGTLLNRHLELRHQSRNEHPLPVFHVLLIQSAGALMFLLPVGAIQGSISVAYNANQWMLLLWLALVASLGAYAILQLLLRHVHSTRVASLTYLVPPATMLQMYVVFGETMSASDLTGIALAAAGVYWVMTSAHGHGHVREDVREHVRGNAHRSQWKLQNRERKPNFSTLAPKTTVTLSAERRRVLDIEL